MLRIIRCHWSAGSDLVLCLVSAPLYSYLDRSNFFPLHGGPRAASPRRKQGRAATVPGFAARPCLALRTRGPGAFRGSFFSSLPRRGEGQSDASTAQPGLELAQARLIRLAPAGVGLHRGAELDHRATASATVNGSAIPCSLRRSASPAPPGPSRPRPAPGPRRLQPLQRPIEHRRQDLAHQIAAGDAAGNGDPASPFGPASSCSRTPRAIR